MIIERVSVRNETILPPPKPRLGVYVCYCVGVYLCMCVLVSVHRHLLTPITSMDVHVHIHTHIHTHTQGMPLYLEKGWRRYLAKHTGSRLLQMLLCVWCMVYGVWCMMYVSVIQVSTLLVKQVNTLKNKNITSLRRQTIAAPSFKRVCVCVYVVYVFV